VLLQLLLGLSGEPNIALLPLPVGSKAGEEGPPRAAFLSALPSSRGTPINSRWKPKYFKDRMPALYCLVSWSICAPWSVLAAASAPSDGSKYWLFMLFPAPREEDAEGGGWGREAEALQQGHSPGQQSSSPGTLACEGKRFNPQSHWIGREAWHGRTSSASCCNEG